MTTRGMPAGPDNFEMLNVADIKGYVSALDPTLAPPNVLIRGSQNVYKTPANTIANRPGRKQFDNVDSTLGGVKAAYVWNTSLNTKRILSIANSKLEVVSDVVTSGTYVHYTLLSGLTKTRGVFDSWWNSTLKKDELIFVLGDTTLYMWQGGIGLLSSTTSNTIVLKNTIESLGFSTVSGSVLINGNTYTYTGSSGSTLTGVTPNPTGEANNSVVISTVVQTASTPSSDATLFSNDFIRVINNRLHVGSYVSRNVYISSNSDYTNYTVPTPRTDGTPELLTLDSVCKGIGVRGNTLNGNAHIFGGSNEMYVVTYKQITVNTTLQEETDVDKKNLGLGGAAYSHEMIDSDGDTLYWLSQDLQVKTYGAYPESTLLQFPIISEDIATDLYNEDFTLGQLKIIGGGEKGSIIYIIAPNSGVVYLYNVRQIVDKTGRVSSERFWHTPFVWGISRIDYFGTTVIGFSNSNPQIYQLWDTLQWHDDGAGSGNTAIQLAYTSIALFSYRSYGRRQGKIHFDKTYWEGYMTKGTALASNIYYDYQGSSGIASSYIHSVQDNSPAKDTSFFTGVVPPSLGDASLGDNPLGDITAVINVSSSLRDHDLVPKFRVILEVPIIDCYEFAPMCFSAKTDDRWELIAVGANITESPFSGVEIIK